jgi:hypothetical protein
MMMLKLPHSKILLGMLELVLLPELAFMQSIDQNIIASICMLALEFEL